MSDTKSAWKRLEEVSKQKREAAEEARKESKYRGRKALEDEAAALAKMESKIQWEIRESADQFLKEHGFTSGGKKRGSRKIPGL
jgi:ElaB/YqjD/DUF883 family membrane-anchored ribosome-binding protein